MLIPFHVQFQDQIVYASVWKYWKYYVGAFGVIFSCINLGATEGNTSAPSSSKQFKWKKTGKSERGKLIGGGGTAQIFCAGLEA